MTRTTTQDTRPHRQDAIRQPRLGPLGTLRWMWRQLTSMRTALFLLLILAVAAVPGSVFPQRSINATRVVTYLAQHRTIGPWLDRLGMFNVFSTPWFAAVYLLLIISLLGCIIPRMKQQLKALRNPLPRVPRRLDRLPAHRQVVVDSTPQEALRAAHAVLHGRRYRTRVDHDLDGAPVAVAAEGGRLREAGNLLFHTCLVLVIIAVAYGQLFGWRGDVIVPVGQSFTSTQSGYDTFSSGALVNPDRLSPFTLQVNKFDVTFEDHVPKDSPQYGQPRDFILSGTSQVPGALPKPTTIRVNHALDIANTEVYLLGNGYAPKITVRNAAGKVLYDQETPFLPQDNTYKSTGVIKVTSASPQQLG